MWSVAGSIRPGPAETLEVVTETTGLRRNLPYS